MLISTAISIDRLLVLFLRLRYRQVVTIKGTQAVILLRWIIAVSCGLVRVRAGQQKVHRDKIKRKSSTEDQTISENSFQHILGAIGFSGMLYLF